MHAATASHWEDYGSAPDRGSNEDTSINDLTQIRDKSSWIDVTGRCDSCLFPRKDRLYFTMHVEPNRMHTCVGLCGRLA
jgi:hypothetical protein